MLGMRYHNIDPWVNSLCVLVQTGGPKGGAQLVRCLDRKKTKEGTCPYDYRSEPLKWGRRYRIMLAVQEVPIISLGIFSHGEKQSNGLPPLSKLVGGFFPSSFWEGTSTA